MKYVLQGGQDFILNQLNAGMQPTEEEIKAELRRQFSLE
jgi:hypothetical protein